LYIFCSPHFQYIFEIRQKKMLHLRVLNNSLCWCPTHVLIRWTPVLAKTPTFCCTNCLHSILEGILPSIMFDIKAFLASDRSGVVHDLLLFAKKCNITKLVWFSFYKYIYIWKMCMNNFSNIKQKLIKLKHTDFVNI